MNKADRERSDYISIEDGARYLGGSRQRGPRERIWGRKTSLV